MYPSVATFHHGVVAVSHYSITQLIRIQHTAYDEFQCHAIFPPFENSVKIRRPKRCAVCAAGIFFSACFFSTAPHPGERAGGRAGGRVRRKEGGSISKG